MLIHFAAQCIERSPLIRSFPVYLTGLLPHTAEASIILDTQHPTSMPKLKALEEKTPEQRPETVQHFEKPVFTMPLTGPSDIIEMQHAHFEARCVPVGDPNLRFEWFCNGKELKLGTIFVRPMCAEMPVLC